MADISLDKVGARLSRVLSNHPTNNTPKQRLEASNALVEELRPELEELMRLREGLPAGDWMYRPKGPALLYVHSTSDAVSAVDLMPWRGDYDPREYAILRALLLYSLKEMNDADS